MSFNIQLHSDIYYTQQTAIVDLTYLFNFNQVVNINEPTKYKVYWNFKANAGAAVSYFPQLNIDFQSQVNSYYGGTQNNNIVKNNNFGCINYNRFSTTTTDFYYVANTQDNNPVVVTLNPNASLINVRLTQPNSNTLITNEPGPYVINLFFEKI